MLETERPTNIIDARGRFSGLRQGKTSSGPKRIDLGLVTLADWGLDDHNIWNVNDRMSKRPEPHKGVL